MADFLKSYNKLEIYEGVYSNNPVDKGGETFRGISRPYHPDWKGWELIDAAKDGDNFYNDLLGSSELADMVKNFYRENYWNSFRGDDLFSQLIADELLEITVNLGLPDGIEIIQSVINLLNRNEKLYFDIIVDCIFGDETLKTLKISLNKNGERLFFNVMNFYQAMQYILIMEGTPDNELFIGWFKRVEVLK
jgi:lysozyme family protein